MKTQFLWPIFKYLEKNLKTSLRVIKTLKAWQQKQLKTLFTSLSKKLFIVLENSLRKLEQIERNLRWRESL